MKYVIGVVALCAVWCSLALSATAQEAPIGIPGGTQRPMDPFTMPVDPAATPANPANPPAEPATSTKEKIKDIADKVDKDERAQEASAGILKSIYIVAQYMSFSAFHWVAFSLMVSGVVSFGLQLVLGKLVMLSKMSFSVMEIVADGLGLLISLVGLVLTTQAATQNSAFTQSPAAVLSSAALGAVVGIIFYFWGQSQELKALKGEQRS